MDDYKQKACPYLSIPGLIGGLGGPRVSLSDPTGVQRTSVEPALKGCIGPKCMFGIPRTAEDGKIVDYACAMAVLPSVIERVGLILGAVGNALLQQGAPAPDPAPPVTVTDSSGTRPAADPTFSTSTSGTS